MKKILIVLLIFIILFINIKTTSSKKEELKGIFISYIELNKYLKNSNVKENINKMINNVDSMKLNIDILEYFIETAHNKNIKVYAWINPYRVRTNENIGTISINNPAYKYIDTDYLYINNGIYFNPSKKEVEDLIVEGVKEVLNYNIDGLLFDDYFYPDNDIDIKDYEEYIKDNK